MKYTDSQIARAKAEYNSFLVYHTASLYNPAIIGMEVAQQRADSHNATVAAIKAGNQELEREWKFFFLNEELKKDLKKEEAKAKLAANKEASADIIAPIRTARKLGEFAKWLNTPGNKFRKQNFTKKYTVEAVEAFMATI